MADLSLSGGDAAASAQSNPSHLCSAYLAGRWSHSVRSNITRSSCWAPGEPQQRCFQFLGRAVAGQDFISAADLSSPNADVAANGERVVADCIAVARDLGAPALGGVTYAALDRYMVPPDADALERVLEAYHRLAERARAAGVRLGIEPVNRYETNLINTLGQAAAVVRAVDPENMFVQMDTYHMNIEEADIAGAIEATKDVLGYAHVGESNRSCMGSGTFDFDAYFKALARANYTGGFTWESFSPAVVNADITGLLALWREPWADNKTAAHQALAFMRAHVDAAWAAAHN